MKIVLDTNVLVSAVLSPFGPPAEVLRLVLTGEVDIAFDARIFQEYRDVLSRPRFAIDLGQREELLEALDALHIPVDPAPSQRALPDPDDAPFLEAARALPACILVTGNRRHFPLKLAEPVEVLSPSQLVERWRSGSAPAPRRGSLGKGRRKGARD